MNKEEKIKAYNRYFNEQMKILKGHSDRIFLRLANKYATLNFTSVDTKANNHNGKGGGD